jgi:hypothetical protein
MSNTPRRYCPRGHDKDTVGRTEHRECLQCNRERALEYYYKKIEAIRDETLACGEAAA